VKLSPRHEPTVQAKIGLSKCVGGLVEKYHLTYPELIAILAQEIEGWTKFQIRDERKEPNKVD